MTTSRPDDTATRVEALLGDSGGILRLDPAWVARDLVPPGRRLGLPEDAYDAGPRGFVCERWLASTTPADNPIPLAGEGLSPITVGSGAPMLLADAVRAAPELILGRAYAAAHPGGLGRLPKLFDYAARLPFHVHPPQEWTRRVDRNSKDEAYHFLPGADLGAHPETFLGVHPAIARGPQAEALLPYLVDWDSDLILRTTQAYLQVPGEGFHVPSGVLHGPGTALTLELQEDSDVGAMFQALNAGRIIAKETLYKDVAPADREREAERAPLRFVDWDRNGDPDLYVRSHLEPTAVELRADRGADASAEGVRREWVFYGSEKFSGQRLSVAPGRTATIVEPGVYSVFAWSGTGTWGGHEITGGDPGRDELLVSYATATDGVPVVNTGAEPLVAYLLSGPDLHPEAVHVAGRDGSW